MNWRANHHYVERADGSCVAQCPSHLNAQRLAGVPDLLASAEELLEIARVVLTGARAETALGGEMIEEVTDKKTLVRCRFYSGETQTAQGEVIEYSYQVRLLDPSYQSELLSRLREIPDVSEAELLMHRTTVEL